MKKHRIGYTTGACASAAAKGATMLLISAVEQQSSRAVKEVEIPFPDGGRAWFKIENSNIKKENKNFIASASVVKDAGDDIDVTNGVEIVATVKAINRNSETVIIKGGKGVGIITKPGLPVAIGESAINPVPRKMIKEAVMEAIAEQMGKNEEASKFLSSFSIEVTISVPDGEKIAKKTLNKRLGIIGGISILGTTGKVIPLSSEAWKATIVSAMNVAKAMGYDEIVLCTGRTSEKAHMNKYNFPEESYVMMGDFVEFAIIEAKKHGFKKIHLCAQWAKMLKIAMQTPQTHIRYGIIDLKRAVNFLKSLTPDLNLFQNDFNTAREIYDLLNSLDKHHLFMKVCNAAKGYAEKISGGIPVVAYLISYESDVLLSIE